MKNEKTIEIKDEKAERINKLQREASIKNSLANLMKDTLSISTQLKANAEAIDDDKELVDICKKHIDGCDSLIKDIASYLAK